MKSYNIFEFDPIKIGTGEIDPTKVVPVLHTPVEQNSTGVITLDRNKDLSNSRRLLSIYATKASNERVANILDLEFVEFPNQTIAPVAVSSTTVTETATTDSQGNTTSSTTTTTTTSSDTTDITPPNTARNTSTTSGVGTRTRVTD